MARDGTPIHVRVTADERLRVEQNAHDHGLKISEYVRLAALGELETSSPRGGAALGSAPASAETPIKVSGAAPGVIPGSSRSGSIPGAEGKVTPLKGGVEGEIEESKLHDAPAREHFLERRTRELHGQGNTTKVARSLAEAEWRSRGNDIPPAAA